MKKLSFFAILLPMALLMQYCKKSAAADDATVTPLFQANINNVVWTPTSVSATLTYSSSKQTKIFSCTATGTTDVINLYIQRPVLKVDSGLSALTYNVDGTTVAPVYSVLTNGVYVSTGTANSGSIIVTAVDSIKKVITGTFSFNASKQNYDGNGNLVSITATQVNVGEFNNMPYKFVKGN
jgi:hypothetical protein